MVRYISKNSALTEHLAYAKMEILDIASWRVILLVFTSCANVFVINSSLNRLATCRKVSTVNCCRIYVSYRISVKPSRIVDFQRDSEATALFCENAALRNIRRIQTQNNNKAFQHKKRVDNAA